MIENENTVEQKKIVCIHLTEEEIRKVKAVTHCEKTATAVAIAVRVMIKEA